MVRFVAAVVLLVGAVMLVLVLSNSGAIGWVAGKFVGQLFQKDDSTYASAIADQLVASPNCAHFQAEIREAGKGAHLGPARTKINNVFTTATAAGCRKKA